jgi:DNA polymerase-1
MTEYTPSHTKYKMIRTAEELEDVLDVVGTNAAALDFEGWNIVRLAQICNDAGWWVIDFGPADDNWFGEVAHWFEDGKWIVFNSGHEKRYFAKYDSYPTCWDVGYLRRAIEGGGHMSLKRLVGWELGIEMDKTEQASAWDDGDLTQSQLDYAAGDALYTWDAWRKLIDRADADHMRAFNLLDGMADGVIEMEEAGLLLDPVYHKTLIVHWQKLSDERTAQIRELVTEDEVPNLNSGKQLSEFYSRLLPDEVLETWPKTEKTGLLSTANKDLMNLAGIYGGTPLGDSFRLMAERSTLQKYLSSFGETLLAAAKRSKDGRVRCRYNIAAAITCRFSSSGPNLQQVPRDRDFFGQRMSIRKGFIAAEGNLLVSYDYSGVEMRVMGLLSEDELLIHDVVFGDVHSEAASLAAGRKVDPKLNKGDKELRQGGKPINFGIIYGTTALGLSGRQGWTFDFADNVIQKWGARYPNAYNMRNIVQTEAKADGYIRMVDGGTIYMGKQRPSLTRCANYPVQRAALSVMARAIIRHKDSLDDLRDLHPDATIMMCSTIHDALIDECSADIAPLVMATMKRDMEMGFLDVFPDRSIERLVEGGMGPNWGELEEV